MNIKIQGDNNVIQKLLLPQLRQCPLAELAISKITSITEIQHGFSQHCFELSTHNKHYIAKVFLSGNVEQHIELTAYQFLNSHTDFTAKLLWSSSHVILLEKISGQLLVSSTKLLTTKLELIFPVLVKLHRLDDELLTYCQPLDFNQLFTLLLTELILPANSLSLLDVFIDKTLTDLTRQLNTVSDSYDAKTLPLVACHGDLNFANVFYQGNAEPSDERVMFIDFECLTLMPREYDLAMLLAVNELDETLIADVERLYNKACNEQLSNDKSEPVLDSQLIQLYYQLALLINGLWYLKKYQVSKEGMFKIKAAKQFSLSACDLTITELIC